MEQDEIRMMKEQIESRMLEMNLFPMFIKDQAELATVEIREPEWYNRLLSLKQTGVLNVFNVAPTITIDPLDTETKKLIGVTQVPEDYYTRRINIFYSVFCATSQDIMVGALTTTTQPVFLLTSLETVRTHSTQAEFDAIINKISQYIQQIISQYKEKMSDDLFKFDIMAYLISDLTIKLGAGYTNFETNLIKAKILIDDALKSGLFQAEDSSSQDKALPIYYSIINSNEMYRACIAELIGQREKIEADAINKGIVLGSRFFTSFQRNGYVYNSSNDMWEKKMNFKPEFCVSHDKMYKLPDDMRKYIVKTLIFDPSMITKGEKFILKADATHPNISANGVVCIGTALTEKFNNLIKNKTLMLSEYLDFIVQVEEAIKIINFDSAYTSCPNEKALIPVDFDKNALKTNRSRTKLERV